MIKWFNRMNRALANAGINASVSVVVALVACGVIAAYVAYEFPIILLPVAIVLYISYHVSSLFAPPPPVEIADSAVQFLDRAIASLHDNLTVFQSVYFDQLPVDDGSIRRFFRWESALVNYNGVSVVRIALLRIGKVALSVETLKQERLQLQGLLSSDLERGCIPLVSHPTYSDGTPTLSLVDIEDTGQYIVFSFVWVNNKLTSDFVHLHDIPTVNDDTDDADF